MQSQTKFSPQQSMGGGHNIDIYSLNDEPSVIRSKQINIYKASDSYNSLIDPGSPNNNLLKP